jgi:hypothetical protein
MKEHRFAAIPAACLVALATPALAADQSSFGHPIEDIRITEPLPSINLSLRNQATIKTVEARRLAVTGPEPQFTVQGIVACKPGARLTGVQALAGSVVNNNGQIMPMQDWGSTPVLTSMAGLPAAQVSIPLRIKVSRTYNGEAVDLTFNPAREFELKLKKFVSNGGSAAQYLQATEAFDMTVPVHLIAWCKADSGVLAGQNRGGYVKREVPATILFEGDTRIIGGAGATAATTGSGGTVTAPQPAQKPKRAQPPKPPRAE